MYFVIGEQSFEGGIPKYLVNNNNLHKIGSIEERNTYTRTRTMKDISKRSTF